MKAHSLLVCLMAMVVLGRSAGAQQERAPADLNDDTVRLNVSSLPDEPSEPVNLGITPRGVLSEEEAKAPAGESPARGPEAPARLPLENLPPSASLSGPARGMAMFLEAHGLFATIASLPGALAALRIVADLARAVAKRVRSRRIGGLLVALGSAGVGACFGALVMAISAWDLGDKYIPGPSDIILGMFLCLLMGWIAYPDARDAGAAA
jgi:hypothetical protein